MNLTYPEILDCLRNDLFPLWRQGKLLTAEALPHAQYVAGGWLALSSGHGGMVFGSRGLETEVDADPALSKTIDEFLAKEMPTREAARSIGGGDFIPRMDFVVQALIQIVLNYFQGKS
jgi:hypothetical protein